MALLAGNDFRAKMCERWDKNQGRILRSHEPPWAMRQQAKGLTLKNFIHTLREWCSSYVTLVSSFHLTGFTSWDPVTPRKNPRDSVFNKGLSTQNPSMLSLWCITTKVDDVIEEIKQMFRYKMTSYMSHQLFFMSVKIIMTPCGPPRTLAKMISYLLLVSVPWAGIRFYTMESIGGERRRHVT